MLRNRLARWLAAGAVLGAACTGSAAGPMTSVPGVEPTTSVGVAEPTTSNDVTEQSDSPRHPSLGFLRAPGVHGVFDLAYGPHRLQRYDVFYRDAFTGAPLLLIVHGGAWGGEDHRRTFYRFVPFFLDAGFVVATTTYRVYQPEDGRHGFPAPVNDIACAAATLRATAHRYGGTAEGTIVFGNSAGAHLGALLTYDRETDWLVECAERTPATIVGFVGSAGIYDYGVDTTNWKPGCFMRELLDLDTCGRGDLRWADTDPVLWDPANPITHVDEGDPPALLITGDRDCTANPPGPDGRCVEHTMRMTQSLAASGVPVELFVATGYGHAVFGDGFDELPEMRRRVAEFLADAAGA